MSRPRFLADHDLNEHIVDGALRREPLLDFLRVRDVRMEKALDAELLAYAWEHRRIVVSHDVNTMPAEACFRMEAGQSMGGLLMVPQAGFIAPIIENLLLIWAASEAEEWEGRVEFLPFR